MISIIIPVYNCKKFIDKTVSTLGKFIESHDQRWEVIFVDDGSTDSTAKHIRQSMIKGMYLVIKESNGGKGAAIKEGINYCKGDYIIFTDADLPYDLKVFTKMVDKFKLDYDVILGSRDLPESSSEVYYGKRRRILSLIFSFLANTVLLSPVSDTQCGIKGFKSFAAKEIFSKLRSKRYSFDVELIYLAQKFKFEIALVPVKLVNHKNSSVRLLQDGFRTLFDLTTLFIRVKFFSR
jgi:dolichyl-phosphate beta-glucosyltransferase